MQSVFHAILPKQIAQSVLESIELHQIVSVIKIITTTQTPLIV